MTDSAASPAVCHSSGRSQTNPRVVFVPGANPGASFVALDRGILRDLADVVEVEPGLTRGARLAFARRLRDALATRRVDLVAVWFGTPGYGAVAALLCRIYRVPLLVIAGGAEVASVPRLGFGDAQPGWRRAIVGRVLRAAQVVWAFSESARREVNALVQPRDLRVVPPAVDTVFFAPAARAPGSVVLTACGIISAVTIRQKGLDRVAALARLRPALSFVITGRVAAGDREAAAFADAVPANVAMPGFVSSTDLRALYAQARVYLQLSAHEGFGVAVVEAMAMGCTPLVSNLPALRALVSEPNLVIENRGAAADALALDRALAGSYAAPEWADLHRRFGTDARRRAWTALFTDLGCMPSDPSVGSMPAAPAAAATRPTS